LFTIFVDPLQFPVLFHQIDTNQYRKSDKWILVDHQLLNAHFSLQNFPPHMIFGKLFAKQKSLEKEKQFLGAAGNNGVSSWVL
jgi:hypothetical protein